MVFGRGGFWDGEWTTLDTLRLGKDFRNVGVCQNMED